MVADHTPRSGLLHERFRSSDPVEVEQYIQARYVDVHLESIGGDTPFSCEFTSVSDPLLDLARMRNTGTMTTRRRSLGELVLVLACRSGGLGWGGTPYGEVRAGPGDVVLAPPACTSGVADGADTDLVSLDVGAVADHAAHVCGIAAGDLRFTGSSPVSPAFERYWLGIVAHIRDTVLDADRADDANDIVLDSAFRSLATALITTFPNTALAAADEYARSSSRPSVPAATLAHVMDYLQGHAARPVGPADVAAVSGTPYRDVVQALRRRYDVEPGRALWDARLRGVRRDLVEAGPDGDSTVAGLAARWGFRRSGAFRTVYAQEFGETPERTFGT